MYTNKAYLNCILAIAWIIHSDFAEFQLAGIKPMVGTPL